MRSLLKNWRHILLLASLLLFACLAYHQRGELVRVQYILVHGKWIFFILALSLQMLFYALQAAMYRQILQIWRPQGFYAIYQLTLSSNSLNKLVPSGGMSGLALFISQAREMGIGTELSLLSNALFYTLDYLSFLLIVWWGLYTYGPTIGLGKELRWGITVFTFLIILATVLVLLAIQNESRLKHWLDILTKYTPIGRAKLQKQGPAIYEAMQLLNQRQSSLARGLFLAFVFAFLMQLADIAILYLCFLTVKYSINLGEVVAGFGLSSITALISMVPQGIGIYETAMTWIYNRMGVPFGIAITVALLYRGVTFWFAIIPGLINMFRRESQPND